MLNRILLATIAASLGTVADASVLQIANNSPQSIRVEINGGGSYTAAVGPNVTGPVPGNWANKYTKIKVQGSNIALSLSQIAVYVPSRDMFLVIYNPAISFNQSYGGWVGQNETLMTARIVMPQAGAVAASQAPEPRAGGWSNNRGHQDHDDHGQGHDDHGQGHNDSDHNDGHGHEDQHRH